MFLEQVLVQLLKQGASMDEICTITGVEQELVTATLERLELLGVIEPDDATIKSNT